MTDERSGEERLSEDFDLGAWNAQEPPSDFAERVLGVVRHENDGRHAEHEAVSDKRRRARKVGVGVVVVAGLSLAAAFAMRVSSAPPSRGEATADARTEVTIGTRARAVLEPGASVHWDGDDIVQTRGDIFYRVEPGSKFVVHTSAADVEVKGTCFVVKVRGDGKPEALDMQKRDAKAAGIGAALTALAFVAVYEGKVAVSHAGERVDLAAGESAHAGADGVKRTGAVGEGQAAFDTKVAASEDPLSKANENLVSQVADYRQRLEAIVTQKESLEKNLKATEEKLAAQADGAASRGRSEYDLDQDDWVALAKKGSVKYRMPCPEKDGWNFTPERLNKVGLAPQDVPAIRDAYQKSYERTWAQVRPLCVQALGNAEVVDKIGLSSCPHIIYDVAQAIDNDATREAHTQAAEIRAGVRPMPASLEKAHPVLRLFLLLTDANKGFEKDLAASFGPEEAHRLAYADNMCTSNSSWGGGKKRDNSAEK